MAGVAGVAGLPGVPGSAGMAGVAGVAGVSWLVWVLAFSSSLAARRKLPAVVGLLGVGGTASAWVAISASARDRLGRVLCISSVLAGKARRSSEG